MEVEFKKKGKTGTHERNTAGQIRETMCSFSFMMMYRNYAGSSERRPLPLILFLKIAAQGMALMMLSTELKCDFRFRKTASAVGGITAHSDPALWHLQECNDLRCSKSFFIK